MKKLILAALLGLSFSSAAAPVINGVSTNGLYSFKAFGNDLVLYKGKKIIEHCVTDGMSRGIDNDGNPFILDFYSCSNGTKTFGIKTFGNINDGGWGFLIETRNGRPFQTIEEAFFISDGSRSL